MAGTSSGKRTVFVYLGRRGALSQFTLDLARVAADRAILVVSRQNELFEQINATGAVTVPVDTFETAAGAMLRLPRIISIRRQMLATLREHDADTVIVLMPHVWTPLIAPTIRRGGYRYIVVVHDAQRHVGDRTGLFTPWLLRDAWQADRVVALSEHVAGQLVRRGLPAERIRTLFHPLLCGADEPPLHAQEESPGLLFFGRIMAYKGLPLFVEACEMLRREGLAFRIGVVGEGSLGALRNRLQLCGAEVINRWLDHDEIPTMVRRYDAIVIPSTEASQSGVVAVAHGQGLPVIVTPVGGLTEQVVDAETGLVASSVSAASIASEMRRFLSDSALRQRMRKSIKDRAAAYSMGRFVQALSAIS
jgi:glycosyltransferase involved in cell wall biosynthesis